MVLESHVRDMSGRMLLKAGSVIAPHHLKVFRTWGVTEVAVVADDEISGESEDVATVAIDGAIAERVEAEIDARFIHVERSHPVMELVIQQVRKSLIRQFQNGSGE